MARKASKGTAANGSRSSDQQIMLALVGTTALPQPYPQVAAIALSGDKKSVEITSIREPYRLVRYTVELKYAEALYLAEEAPERLEREQFRLSKLEQAIGSGVSGILFTKDDAPVIYQTETAVPAVDIPGCDRPISRTKCD